jgi:pyruvate dehydrogenase E1 component alpha subunit
MQLIRAFEDAAEAASRGGVAVLGASLDGGARVRGPLHLSTGQEAVAAGVCANLAPHDLVTSTHRGHGHTLAKGADPARMMSELFGRADGCNGGRGGSMHLADFSIGMLGANGVVAAGIPIACGAAHALRLRGGVAIVACFFGDGAINRGPFLEGLNWAKVFSLPVLFVCEDNRYSATTSTAAVSAGEGAAARAAGLGVASLTVDGNDVEAVDAATARLTSEVRAGDGPRLLHAITYRLKGHVSVDSAAYRVPGEVDRALADDPLTRAATRLAALGVPREQVERVRAEAMLAIEAAVAAAAASPPPPPTDAFREVQDAGAGAWA